MIIVHKNSDVNSKCNNYIILFPIETRYKWGLLTQDIPLQPSWQMNNVDLKSIIESNTDEIKLNIITQHMLFFFGTIFLHCIAGTGHVKHPEFWYHVGSKTDTNIFEEYAASGGTWWHSWLRHCTTNWKVTGLIPDGVIGIFHWLNPSSCTITPGSTQPVTELSTRDISWEVKMAGA